MTPDTIILFGMILIMGLGAVLPVLYHVAVKGI